MARGIGRLMLPCLVPLAVALGGCGPRPLVSDTQPAGSTTSDGSFPYREYIDAVYNRHDPSAISRYFSSNVVVHSALPDAPDGNGTAYLEELARGLFAAFPDVKLTVADVFQHEDRVAARLVLEGTQTGEFAGMAPTGRKVKVSTFAHYRVAGGKIVEVWSLIDQAAIVNQLTEKK